MALVNGEELRPASPLNVVLFSGGRGSAALARQLVSSPGVNLTIVINGYDDGASTGEVRRFLGDSLGPSDFRKNASNLAAALRTCPAELIDLSRSPMSVAIRGWPRRCRSSTRLDSGAAEDAFAAETATLFQSIRTRAANCRRRRCFERFAQEIGRHRAAV